MVENIILAIIAAIVLIFIVYNIIKISKLSTNERKAIIKKWLISAVVFAENAYKEQGKGSEKMQDVINDFNKNAPILCKILLSITKSANLNDLIEESLEFVKNNFEQ